MKQRTKPIEEKISFMGGGYAYVTIRDELINEWECENCGAEYGVELEVCEVCGR